MNDEPGLIFACDVSEQSKALEIVDQIRDLITAVKVNYPLVLSSGIEVIEKLSDYCPVIADFKVADVPHTNKAITREVFENKASGIICHSFLGKESLLACKKLAKQFEGDVFSVVEMSHPGAERFIHYFAREMINISIEIGVDGVIAPGNDIKRLKEVNELIPDDLVILSPGIGAQGGKAKKAVEAGADYIIVGRKIYESSNPRNVAEELFEEIR